MHFVANAEYIILFKGCGEYTLIAYSWPGSRPGSTVWNGLHYTIRQPPFVQAELVDMDYKVDFSAVTTENDRVAVITTKPLTSNESWVEIKRGELLMFDKGLPYFQASACASAEREGRGLCSKIKNNTSNRQKRSRFQSMDSIMIPNEVCALEDTMAGSSNVQQVEVFMKNVLQSH